jgi:hypothetical protein
MGGSGWMAALVGVCLVAAPVHAQPRASHASSVRVSSDAGGSRALVAPLLWVLGALGVPVEDPAPLPNSEALERSQGWRSLEFPVQDEGLGAYLEVRGRVEFESAEVRFADGTSRTVAPDHAVRGKGLYLLADFGRMTAVTSVIVNARSRDGEARVGVRLGR